MGYRDYRELLVWSRARLLAMEVCKVKNGPRFRRDWGFRDQMRRAAVSVPSNIAEGNERGSDRDANRFFYFPLLAAQWTRECDELGRMLRKLIQSRLRACG